MCGVGGCNNQTSQNTLAVYLVHIVFQIWSCNGLTYFVWLQTITCFSVLVLTASLSREIELFTDYLLNVRQTKLNTPLGFVCKKIPM